VFCWLVFRFFVCNADTRSHAPSNHPHAQLCASGTCTLAGAQRSTRSTRPSRTHSTPTRTARRECSAWRYCNQLMAFERAQQEHGSTAGLTRVDSGSAGWCDDISPLLPTIQAHSQSLSCAPSNVPARECASELDAPQPATPSTAALLLAVICN
jgi:hypothetical protein